MSQDQSTTNNSIGKPVDRVDGRLKVTGAAHYSAEYEIPDLVHAVLVTSTIAKGRITAMNTRVAETSPGVFAVLTHLNMPKLAKQPKGGPQQQPGMSFAPLQGPDIHYNGQHIAIVIAETLEQAEHAATLVQVSYRQDKHVATMRDPTAQVFQPERVVWGRVPGSTRRGNPQQTLAQAAIRLSETYTLAFNHHNPLESSGTIAVWEGDKVTLYDSTQGVTGTQLVAAEQLGIPQESVCVIAGFVGGGFGCKSASYPHTAFAAIAARHVGRPVKLILTRQQMYTSVGHREEQKHRLTLGAERDGRLITIIHEKTSPTSPFDEWSEPAGNVINMAYQCQNFESRYNLVRTNMMTPMSTRGPGEVPGMFVIDSAIDELAYKLNLDPIEIRLRNHADRNPATGLEWSSKSLKQCYARGAELFGWSQRRPTPRSMRQGRYLIGMGMATGTYPVYPSQSSARARIFADGRALVQSGLTDIGTGTYTVMTQVAADALGLPLERVRFELGNSDLPTGAQSGGSTAAAAGSSGVHVACTALLRKIVELASADEKSPLRGAEFEDVGVENGHLFLKTNRAQGETYVELLARQNMPDVEAVGSWKFGDQTATPVGNPSGRPPGARGEAERKYSSHSFGADFAEVRVDPDLGEVRVTRFVGVFGAGRILNRKTAVSQMRGGIIWGISQALFEETYMDERFGRYVNQNLGEYHVAVNADIPDIQVEFIEENDPHINVLGVKGVGELAMVGAAAAVANAIFHATGKRIRDLPITPDKLL